MRTRRIPLGRVAALAATPVAILAASALIWQSSQAAFTGVTRNSGNEWATGAVNLTDDDTGRARFVVNDMLPGQTDTQCIKVTAVASTASTVKGYIVNPVPSGKGLEQRIKITMEAGTGGGYNSCNGFTGTGVVIPGATLAALAEKDTYEEAVGGWDIPADTTASRTYKISWTFDTTGMTQAAIDQLQGSRTGIDIQWELRTTTAG